jgi:hypothetical protein
VKKVWHEWNPTEMPKGLVDAIEQSNDAKELLKTFGNVLVPESKMTKCDSEVCPPCGSLLSLPGSVIHAGPASNDARAVLFFSSCPTMEAIEYNPDTQYSGVFLCGQLVTLLWRMPGIGAKEREYLLFMVSKYIEEQSTDYKWADHFVDKGFIEFVRKIEAGSSNVASLIQETANNEELCFYNHNDFVAVSVDGLLTVDDAGNVVEIQVLYRQEDKVIIIKQGKDMWHGTLHINERKEIGAVNLFDGSNGELHDPDGNKVKCFCMPIFNESPREAVSKRKRDTNVQSI